MEKKEDNLIVFISYSWDTEEHKQWVLDLANKLSENGVYVLLDRFDLKAGKSMTHFMEKAVNQADKILLIMTPNYKDKADNRTGGVGYEYSMISQEFYEKMDNEKFIPIRKEGDYKECAPRFLNSYLSHNMTDVSSFDKDYEELLRIIYDEPEIKRPPLGKKPNFITTKMKQNLNFIDVKKNLQLCKMPTYAKWSIDIHIKSLNNQTKSNLYNLISSNTFIDKNSKQVLPLILSNSYKISHQPDIVYEVPLHREMAYNHLTNEVLIIEKDLLHYEFSEYGNQDFWLLSIRQPFSTLFYLTAILKKVYVQLGINEIDIAIDVSFVSDRKSMLYSHHSPFDFPRIYSLQNMIIPNNKANISLDFKDITKDTVFNELEKLYSVFSAENQKSQFPFVKLDREHFEMISNGFI